MAFICSHFQTQEMKLQHRVFFAHLLVALAADDDEEIAYWYFGRYPGQLVCNGREQRLTLARSFKWLLGVVLDVFPKIYMEQWNKQRNLRSCDRKMVVET